MPQVNWKDALIGKPAVQSMVQDIVDQVPEAHGARDAFESCLNVLASYIDPEKEAQLEIYQALVDGGVEDWDGYDDALSDAGIGDDDEAPEDESEEDEED
jgi:hypothetical protein